MDSSSICCPRGHSAYPLLKAYKCNEDLMLEIMEAGNCGISCNDKSWQEGSEMMCDVIRAHETIKDTLYVLIEMIEPFLAKTLNK